MTLAELIYVWGFSAIVLAIPTGLVAMWVMCRSPAQAQKALPKAAKTPPRAIAA